MNFYIDKTQFKNGITQYTYWVDFSNSPAGIMWVQFAKGQSGKVVAFLLNAFTAQWYRRKGVCKKLHEEILKDSDVMISPSGSDEGGLEFLKSFGFEFNEKMDMWIFTRGA